MIKIEQLIDIKVWYCGELYFIYKVIDEGSIKCLIELIPRDNKTLPRFPIWVYLDELTKG
jgi:hypothetical protein